MSHVNLTQIIEKMKLENLRKKVNLNRQVMEIQVSLRR